MFRTAGDEQIGPSHHAGQHAADQRPRVAGRIDVAVVEQVMESRRRGA
jgi:hypothetical protein